MLGTVLPPEALRAGYPQGWEILHRPPMLWSCQVCGLPLQGHPRCRQCSILLGPLHIDPDAPDHICRSCRNHSTLGDDREP